MKHSHGSCVVGAFGKILHEGSIWTGHKAILYFILQKSIFIHFVHNGAIFYDKYITSGDINKYIDDDGSGVFLKQKVRKRYNARYQKTYSNQYYVFLLLYKIYNNKLDILRKKMKGNRLCLSKWLTTS